MCTSYKSTPQSATPIPFLDSAKHGENNGGRFSPRPSRAEAVRSLRRPAHWYYHWRRGLWQVEEVAFPVEAAAKTIHAILHGGPNELSKAAAEFVRECQLMSTVRHPNVVQCLGVAFFAGSRLPALVMERLLTSLHDLLAPDTPPPPGAPSPLAFFSVVLKCSVLHNVACGLAYLHERSPPVIHRDLSARNS